MKKGLTELVMILDKSGSMYGLEEDSIGGCNSMIEKQKNEPGECRLTTILFDNRIELLHDRIDIRAVKPLTGDDYRPGGSTALIDAIGYGIKKIIGVQKNCSEDYKAEKVIFIIITDGMENSSREFSSDQVKKMIEHEKKKYGWEFIFLGANIDSVETASRFGIDADRAVDYISDRRGTALNYKVMSDAVSEFRACGSIAPDAFSPIRADAKARGGKRPRRSR